MKRMLLGTVLMTGLLTAGLGCCGTGGLCGAGGCFGGSHGGSDDCASGQCGAQAQQQMGHVAYPYYTVRGPRDFLADF